MNENVIYPQDFRNLNDKFMRIIGLVLSLLVLTACGNQTRPTPTSEPSPSEQANVETQTGENGQIIATNQPDISQPTIAKTAGSTESLSPPPTATAVQLSLPTSTPNAEELRQQWQLLDNRVSAVMSTNNGCQLPCWWGIELGDLVTNARQVLVEIDENGWITSSDKWGDLEEVGFFKHTYRDVFGEDIFASFKIDLLTQDGHSIRVMNIQASNNISSASGTSNYIRIGERILRDWEQYSVKNMFATFGEPDFIYLLPRSFADGDNFFYEFNIYYESLGIIGSYSFPLLVGEEGKQTMCLNVFDLKSLNLYLFNPSIELPESYLQATYSLWPLATALAAENSQLVEGSDLTSRTGQTIDEFVQFVLNRESEEVCFTTN